ncbi:hypothetical protein, partial [Pseudomonas allii]|uniref:hypothetical protein n=1 Tax=Pseudomonas allii TaxID=2740531 RepID=UPI00196285C8
WLAVNQALANQPDAVVTLLGPLRGPNAGQARSPQQAGSLTLGYVRGLIPGLEVALRCCLDLISTKDFAWRLSPNA